MGTNNFLFKVLFDKVSIDLNMFGTIMLNKVLGDVNCSVVITKQVHFGARSKANLSKLPSQPQ